AAPNAATLRTATSISSLLRRFRTETPALTTMPFTHQSEGLVWDATSFRVVPTSSKRNAMIRRASAGTSFAPDRSSMSVQRRIDAFLTLADRGVRAANVLFDEDLFEDATLYVQQVVERVARALLTHAGVSLEPATILVRWRKRFRWGIPLR